MRDFERWLSELSMFWFIVVIVALFGAGLFVLNLAFVFLFL